MDTRASTRTRLSVLPVAFALFFNLLAPVLSVAVPDAAPEALQPQAVGAADDPAFVNFTLEGCREPSVDLETTNFICADADYTTGNLGKTWNELDLVPHRLTTSLGEQAGATTTYTMGITADYLEDGVPGYDVLTAPVVNAGKSDASCQIIAGAQTVITPGVGGTDSSLGRLLTITQEKGTTCVFDWVERLALGSSGFPGSSLHSNRTNQLWSTQGIGAADVSIPVKEILPQEISKTMSATQGQAYGWSIQKSANPTSLNFANTCLDTPGARSAQVAITITWTRSGPTASGDTTITTNIYATNPAHRSVIVNVTDRIYAGADQSTLLDTASSGPVSVAAGSDDVLVLTHAFVYNGSASSFNDVATATYTDEDLGIAVPGTTTATASATTQASGGPIKDASVLITDTESITGDGLAFSVATPSIGAFTGGYVAGASTTGPVGWQYTATNSGSVTFTKTVTVDQPRITSGTLSDTATITGEDGVIASYGPLNVGITASADVSLQINKTIPAGSLRSGESVTFDFDVTGPAGYDEDASITFNYGDPLTKSTTLTGLAPGEYTVSEVPQANWADHLDQVTTITLPNCSGSVSFNNSTLAPDLGITKEADADTVNAGEEIGFSIVVSNDDEAGTGVAKDVELNDPLPGSTALGIDWQLDAVLMNGAPVADPSVYCEITGSAPTQTLECEFGDMAAGASFEVQVSSDTAAPNGCENATLPNTATAWASNHDEVEASDSITVECPDLDITKTASSETVSAGETIAFTIIIENSDAAGTGTALNVTLNDPLPGSLALGVDWVVDAVWLNDVAVADASAYCEITGSAPAQTLVCDFGDLAPGDSAKVEVNSETSAPDGCLTADLENQATASADNHEDIDADATITVGCPDLSLVKEAADDLVSVGEVVAFSMTVSNSDAAGVGTAFDVTLNDPLPGNAALGIDWDFEGVWFGSDPVTASDYCEITGSAPAQTLVCDFGDLEPGESFTVVVVSETANLGECETANLQNVATADASNHEEITAEDSIIIECPGLNIVKTADADPINAGEEASFTITVWNAGPGTAFGVTLHDTLPAGLAWDYEVLQGDADCGLASSLVNGGTEQWSIDCDLGDLPASEMEEGVIIRVFADTDRDDCGLMENTAFADATNDDEVSSTDDLYVRCTVIGLEKENDAVGSVLPGTTVTYTLTLTVSDGPAEDVMVVDSLPVGLTEPTNISDGGVASADGATITWDLGDLADGEYTLTYDATVADDVANGEELINAAAATSTNSQCPDVETLGPECEDDSTVIVRVPTLVIDKVADADVITITTEGDDVTVEPAIVTWTLTYTLGNGPVTNAVISDPLPVGLVYVEGSASDGGVYNEATNTLTWTFATLTESGSVTFQTEVDPGTISRVAPTVNVAVISSDETPEDEGEDQVSVVAENVEGGNPTPSPKPLPDTAAGFGINGEPITVPIELLVAFFIGSLGAMALANVKARGRRR